MLNGKATARLSRWLRYHRFFLLGLLSRFAVANLALSTVAGAVAIAAFPIATLFLGLTRATRCAGICEMGLALELIVVLIRGTLFYLRKRLISGALMIIALVFHFAIRAWLTSSYVNILGLVTVSPEFRTYAESRRLRIPILPAGTIPSSLRARVSPCPLRFGSEVSQNRSNIGLQLFLTRFHPRCVVLLRDPHALVTEKN